MNRPFLERPLLVLNSDLLCWPHLVKNPVHLIICSSIHLPPVTLVLSFPALLPPSWNGSPSPEEGALMRPLQCLCVCRCSTGFQCRYKIIAVGGGETSQKRLREEKAWRGEERKDDAVIREAATRRPSYTHRSHVHAKSSYRLIWGQKASILLPLHTTRLWHTFTGHVLFNTNGEGEIWVHVPVHVSLSHCSF